MDRIPAIQLSTQQQPSDAAWAAWINEQVETLFKRFQKGFGWNNGPEALKYLVTKMANFPPEVILEALDSLPAKLNKEPTIAQILDACYEVNVRYQEHVRLRSLPPPEKREWPKYLGTQGDGGPGTVYSNYDEAMMKHGSKAPKGAFASDREYPYNSR